ncbi:Rrm [Yamadazyma tenuis]|uniref:RNA-binding domain-containing protein n=1 Tax=Candida tenuis (strain ATCC 10573 / BCRC 21748 / CBS 615 / JCM 9827 / NBRC 10315 / NRRL Y-1498 / VKM Y-70) TaxID=590646 RepID=G3B103_CANTC|nr:RNA-binding domain-containing protein [Yamadazyma tenuis ATCC 10573]EGV64850.1 RNA-binding domain-containing protein [Yamadazyma tenuis ATCC 10573]WEJ97644.1 Rrm [Yamadazyma tenuis]
MSYPPSKEDVSLKLPVNLTTTTNTASQQHQQEQELLANFAIPNPPITSATPSNETSAPKEGGSVSDDNVSVSSPHGTPRTLWMGDLDPWLDELGIEHLWWQILRKKVSIKLIRPKIPKQDMGYNMYSGGLSHSGYCFIEFETFEDAKYALSLNGQLLPDVAIPSQTQFPNNPDNQKKYFRLNWASGATLSAPIVQSPEYSLFVGDLSASTTEAHLLAFFQKSFPRSVKTVRVMTDPVNGKSRCFGFVRFTDESERQRALHEMNGVWFGGRPLRVALATPRYNKKSFDKPPPQEMMYMTPFGFYGTSPLPPPGSGPGVPMAHLDEDAPSSDSASLGASGPSSPGMFAQGPAQGQLTQAPPMGMPINGFNSPMMGPPRTPILNNQHGQPYNDPTNTTVFVGGLSSEVSEQTLFALFQPFGVVQQIKIPPGKNCGFVKYSTREEAEDAIASMQGYIIGGNRVRLSWGRVSVNNKKFQHQQQQVAQAAQMQAAAALSMGYDPASAIAAAAAAAAAGGYPHPPPPGIPPGAPPAPPGMPPHVIPHHQMPPRPMGMPLVPGASPGVVHSPHQMFPPAFQLASPPGPEEYPDDNESSYDQPQEYNIIQAMESVTLKDDEKTQTK